MQLISLTGERVSNFQHMLLSGYGRLLGRALDQKASLVRLPGDRSASLRAALRQVSGDGDELDEEHARLHRLTTPTSLDRKIW
ncbi:MAG: hypothetical protein Ct9H90mP11_07080 [Acidimicrobiales bacterium]|nr:MAG: hypothetical protein Ct9H90mP11_07080 [Acidimicrobiales bacterium]